MKVLLVEDEDAKRDNIRDLINKKFPDIELVMAKSVRSAIRYIRDDTPSILLLDMSLPTFDVAPDETGGRPQGFGGIEILRYLERYRIHVATIVITAYEAFYSDDDKKDFNLRQLSIELQERHAKNYTGLIYYNSIFGDWQEELINTIESLTDDSNENSDS